MLRVITKDDIIDIFLKGRQRGIKFILSKFTFSGLARTQSAFNETAKQSSNWWDIPSVRLRWNEKITGSENTSYEQYLIQTVLSGRSELTLLSLGSGTCEHEIELAKYKKFKRITCVDLSASSIAEAKAAAQKKQIQDIDFICSDIKELNLNSKSFDIVLFNASLHHFKDVDSLLSNEVINYLKDSGLLVINEFVGPNRLQFPKEQIIRVNEAIKLIPKKYRRRYKSSLYKRSFSGSGYLRMIIADPSECIDSISIMSAVHKYFEPIIEKPYGGNILMNALKDIAHNFYDLDKEKKEVLKELFLFEDNYLLNNHSDFVFGVYQKKNIKKPIN